jgi:hypothetical protein
MERRQRRAVKNQKKSYTSPTLKKWGTVASLTQVNKQPPSVDVKNGASLSMGA